MKNAEAFFAAARERYTIMLRREADVPRELWTEDPVFKQWRLCNVHREHDRTTVWFRIHVRDPLSRATPVDLLKIVKATVAFRWFNRVETGEKIKDLLLGTWSGDEAHARLRDVRPVVTGAYMIKTPTGRDKLSGVLDCIDDAFDMLASFDVHPGSLRRAWEQLCRIPFMGPFIAYEVVSDLRWTPVLEDANDVMIWTNAGPGCTRGASRVVYGHPDGWNRGSARAQAEMLDVMRELLAMSRDERYWPQAWRPWELREVEHVLCEYDKIERARGGERLKRRFV